jgi:hypothetical protein
MTERSIFLEALDISDATQRSAFLDSACAGDTAQRQRVESLLKSHAQAGDFPGKLGPERVAEELAQHAPDNETQAAPSGSDSESQELDFLTPIEKPGVLGRLGHYDILEIVGRGGMGVVLRAFDDTLHRVVAIKVMAQQLATNATARKRFTREAQAQAAVSHDHVVTIHAVEEANGLPYLVMQYVAGRSLQQRMDRDGPLQLQEILRIGMQIASGLAAAHAQGLVHRDIKPANILLENGVERVKITDFGLARAASEASLTQSGVVAGTPQYMSPEQAEGKPIDQRTDLFSLGSVLYAICTGRPPFRAPGTFAVLKRVCEATPQPIRESFPEAPPWLVEIIARLHAKLPAERFQSAAEVAELLGRRLAEIQHPTADPIQPGPIVVPRRRRWPRVATVLLLVAVGLGVMEAAGVIRLVPALHRAASGPAPGNGEKQPTTDPPPAPAATGPFVILAQDGRAEQKLETLAEAVQFAGDGDTIEIRGDGPFETGGVRVHGRDLVIRAGPGCRPVLALSARGRGEDRQIIWSDAALALEGLTLQRIGSSRNDGAPLINTVGSPLRVANCRFVVEDNAAVSIWGHSPPTMDVRNCEIYGSRVAVESGSPKEGTVSVDNCLLATRTGVYFHHDQQVHRVDVRLTRNTFVGRVAMGLNISLVPDFFTSGSRPEARRFGLEVENNVFAVKECTFGVSQGAEAWRDKPVPTGPFKTLVTDLVGWRDQRNLYPANAAFMTEWKPGDRFEPLLGSDQLDQWQQFAGPEAGELRGKVLFAGDDVLTQSITGPERLLPKHFSLRPQSPGYRAGKDGKDLGADIDLVGPGPAYERWKKTPEYQHWLKETGQKK